MTICSELMDDASDELYRIHNEIIGERRKQDEEWGGPEHEDTHGAFEWMEFRRKREEKMTDAYMQRGRPFDAGYFHNTTRRELVIMAALCVAQIESMDRIYAEMQRNRERAKEQEGQQ